MKGTIIFDPITASVMPLLAEESFYFEDLSMAYATCIRKARNQIC